MIVYFATLLPLEKPQSCSPVVLEYKLEYKTKLLGICGLWFVDYVLWTKNYSKLPLLYNLSNDIVMYACKSWTVKTAEC